MKPGFYWVRLARVDGIDGGTDDRMVACLNPIGEWWFVGSDKPFPASVVTVLGGPLSPPHGPFVCVACPSCGHDGDCRPEYVDSHGEPVGDIMGASR